MTYSLDAFVETAHALADAAGGIAREVWFGGAETTYKADASALTEADTRIEARLRDMVLARHPGHGILGEEFGAEGLGAEFVWVIDPIDGTRQFGARLLNFGVLVALCRAGRPVLGLMDLPLAGARFLGVDGRGTTLNGVPVRASGVARVEDAVVALANPNSFGRGEAAAYGALKDAGRMQVFDGGCVAYGALARGQVDPLPERAGSGPLRHLRAGPHRPGSGRVHLGMGRGRADAGIVGCNCRGGVRGAAPEGAGAVGNGASLRAE